MSQWHGLIYISKTSLYEQSTINELLISMIRSNAPTSGKIIPKTKPNQTFIINSVQSTLKSKIPKLINKKLQY